MRNLFYSSIYSLSEYAVGPFVAVKEGGYNVLVATARETGERSKLRLANSVVKLNRDNEWIQPSFGSIRLYVPK